jgi:hypothetical protein
MSDSRKRKRLRNNSSSSFDDNTMASLSSSDKDVIPAALPPVASPRLQAMGFQYDPFWDRAEDVDPDVIDKTYSPSEDYADTVLDIDHSATLLAPAGGGKTAGRLRLTAYLMAEQKKALKMLMKGERPSFLPLFVSYNNFGNLIHQIPTINDHLPLLLDCIASSIYEFIYTNVDLFMNLDIEVRDFWWSFLETYRIEGSLISDLEKQGGILLTDCKRKRSHSSSFRSELDLTGILRTVVSRLRDMSITTLFVLVDDIDAQSSELAELDALILPLLNKTLFFPGIIWKFFLPEKLYGTVHHSISFASGLLKLLPIQWDEASLKKFLELRLSWAWKGNNNVIGSIAGNCDLAVIAKIGDIDAKLARLALRHQYYGPPRAILNLARQLYECGNGLQITIRDWDYFFRRAQKELDVKDNYDSMIVSIKGESGKIFGTGFLTRYLDQIFIITCSHVIWELEKQEGDTLELGRIDSRYDDFRGKILWCTPQKIKDPVNLSALEDVCIIEPVSDLEVDDVLELAGLQDRYEGLSTCSCFGFLGIKGPKGEWFENINSERRVGADFIRLSQTGPIKIGRGVSGAPLYSVQSAKIIGIIQSISGKDVAYLIPGYVIHRVLEKMNSSSQAGETK